MDRKMNDLLPVLLSGLVSAIVVEIIRAIIDKFQTNAAYKLDYHKKIIDKQFAVYEKVEDFLNLFSTAVTDYKDNRFYYAIFGEKNPLQTKYVYLINFFTKSNIWITEELRNALMAINRLIIENGINFENIEDGKKYYRQLGELRDKALLVWKNDIVTLDDFKKFKKQIIESRTEIIKIKSIK